MATPALPGKPVSAWKRLAIVSFFGGAGFAVTLAIILGSFAWYNSRPKPPQPWNTTAVVATYDSMSTIGDDNNIVFYYVLQNTTDHDYKLQSNYGITLYLRLAEEKSLSSFHGKEKIMYPIFVPSKQSFRMGDNRALQVHQGIGIGCF